MTDRIRFLCSPAILYFCVFSVGCVSLVIRTSAIGAWKLKLISEATILRVDWEVCVADRP